MDMNTPMTNFNAQRAELAAESGMKRSRDLFIGEWKPIESAPKDGTEVLLASITDIGLCYWREDNVMTGWTWGLRKAFRMPTHWMPLPKLPTTTA